MRFADTQVEIEMKSPNRIDHHMVGRHLRDNCHDAEYIVESAHRHVQPEGGSCVVLLLRRCGTDSHSQCYWSFEGNVGRSVARMTLKTHSDMEIIQE